MDKVFVGARTADLDTSALPVKISRVTLKVDAETTYTAGDDTGRTLEKTCLWGTQAMCEGILASVRGVNYQPFSGTDGLLDPAAEVGDGITIGGVYSGLIQTDITFDGLYTADASAPGSNELEDEYPYKSRARRLEDRQLSQTYSRIIKTAEMIRLEVVNEVAGLNARITLEVDRITSEVNDTAAGLSSKIEQTASSLTSQITATDGRVTSLTQTVDGILGRVQDAEGNIGQLSLTATQLQSQISATDGRVSRLTQTVDSIDISVSNGADSSTIRLMKNGIAVSSREISFTGVVTFNDLRGNQTIIDGSVIDTGTLYLDSLYGSIIYLRDPSGAIGAQFNLAGASTARNACELWARALRLSSYPGDIYLDARSGSVTLSAGEAVTCANDFYPTSNNRYTCGSSYFRWSDIYATNDTIQTSDREKKSDIRYGLEDYEALFDRLRPVSYKLVDGQSGRTHLGMISQDVEEALEECGISSQDFAGFVKTPRQGEAKGYDYSLRYGEFIALLVYEVQRMKKEIRELKGEKA